MIRLALRLLMGDRAKFAGILVGLTFASLLITQQASIYVGLMSRSYGGVVDNRLPDIWVMDPNVRTLDLDGIKPMPDTVLQRVRSVPGIAWAVPHYRTLLNTRMADGKVQGALILGLDDGSLIGGPPEMVAGTLADLRREDGIVVDENGARKQFARPDPVTGEPIPLRVGDVLEINDHRALVVGLSRNTRTFIFAPIIYTTYTRALRFAPPTRKTLSYVLVAAAPGVDHDELCRRIEDGTGFKAVTHDRFKQMSYDYFFANTGIPINFGISVLLGFLVGTAIAGQTFYNFVHDHLRHFAALKAMGATNGVLLRMILAQAGLLWFIGYGLGVGLASLFGWMVMGTELAFLMRWELLLISAAAVGGVSLLAAMVSARTVFRLEPAVVFK